MEFEAPNWLAWLLGIIVGGGLVCAFQGFKMPDLSDKEEFRELWEHAEQAYPKEFPAIRQKMLLHAVRYDMSRPNFWFAMKLHLERELAEHAR